MIKIIEISPMMKVAGAVSLTRVGIIKGVCQPSIFPAAVYLRSNEQPLLFLLILYSIKPLFKLKNITYSENLLTLRTRS